VSVIPSGKLVPLGSTPNVPPLTTPGGSVAAKSYVVTVPATKYGHGLTFQTVGGGEGKGDGGGGDGGRGGGDGGAEGGGGGDLVPESSWAVAAEYSPPHPARSAAHANRPSFSALRRSNVLLMNMRRLLTIQFTAS